MMPPFVSLILGVLFFPFLALVFLGPGLTLLYVALEALLELPQYIANWTVNTDMIRLVSSSLGASGSAGPPPGLTTSPQGISAAASTGNPIIMFSAQYPIEALIASIILVPIAIYLGYQVFLMPYLMVKKVRNRVPRYLWP